MISRNAIANKVSLENMLNANRIISSWIKLLTFTGRKRHRLVIHQAEISQTTNRKVLLLIAQEFN